MRYNTDDLRIVGIQEVLPPAQLHEQLPISDAASETVFNARTACQDILHQRDDRLIVIIGPCSIHDPNAARDYASRLQPLIRELADDLHIIMRVYFEKPRSVVGWKGLINDPYLDGSFKINDGLHIGAQSVHAPQKVRRIVNWRPVCPARSVSKTQLMVVCRLPSMPACLLLNRIISCH